LEIFSTLLDLVLHLDVHLGELIRNYGAWVYAILFGIIFAETGLVVAPFLPGDSLLFVAGALAAVGGLDIHLLVATLIVAAVLGNTVNYSIGRYVGRKLFTRRQSRWLNPEHLERTHDFYERHGALAVVISRFLPILRTYIPFVAGLGTMTYPRFTLFNVIGATLWVASLCYLGHFFGNVPWVKENLSFLILAILVVSAIPVAIALLKSRKKK
jgi:membrane-associated protein